MRRRALLLVAAGCGRLGFEPIPEALDGVSLTAPDAIASSPAALAPTLAGFVIAWEEIPSASYVRELRFARAPARRGVAPAATSIFTFEPDEEAHAIAVIAISTGHRIVARTTTRIVIVDVDPAGRVIRTADWSGAGIGLPASAALAPTEDAIAIVGVTTAPGYGQIVGMAIDPEGNTIAGPTNVSTTTTNQSGPSVVATGTGYVVAWEEAELVRAVQTDLTASKPGVAVTPEHAGTQIDPRLAVGRDGAVWVGWVDDERAEIRLVPTDAGVSRWPMSAPLAPQPPRQQPQFTLACEEDRIAAAVIDARGTYPRLDLIYTVPDPAGSSVPPLLSSRPELQARRPALAAAHGVIAVAYESAWNGENAIRFAIVEELP